MALSTTAGATTNSIVACDNVYGPGGLVAAINAANAGGGGNILLAPNCTYFLTHADNTFQGANGLPVITSPVTISGSNSTIERPSVIPLPRPHPTPAFRILLVDNAGNLTLQSLVITGGLAAAGAALVNHGHLTANSVRVTGNIGTSGGAAVANGPGPNNGPGVLVLNNSRVDDNLATATNGAGGIGNGGTATLNNAEVDHNNIPNAGFGSGGGAGIFNFSGGGGAGNGPGILTINSSRVHDNNAPGGLGGGIWNSTEGATVATVTIVGSLVSNNSAADGGGIFNGVTGFGPGGTVNLVAAVVSGNTPNNCAPPGSVPGCSG